MCPCHHGTDSCYPLVCSLITGTDTLLNLNVSFMSPSILSSYPSRVNPGIKEENEHRLLVEDDIKGDGVGDAYGIHIVG